MRTLLLLLALAFGAASCSKKRAAEPRPVAARVTIGDRTDEIDLVAAYEPEVMEELLRAYLGERPDALVRPNRGSPETVVADLREGRTRADVVIGLPREHLDALAAQGLLQPAAPPECAEIPAEHRGAGGRWTGLTLTAVAFGVNSQLLREKQIPAPRRWPDLARPRYRGWIVIARPAESRAAMRVVGGLAAMLHPRGWDLWRRIDKNLFQYAARPATPARLVAKGDAVIAIDDERELLALRRAGKPIEIVYPRPTFFEVEGIAILQGARHPGAAARFLAWTCGERAMRLLERSRTAVTRPFVEPVEAWKPRPGQLTFYKPQRPWVRERILAEWRRRFGK